MSVGTPEPIRFTAVVRPQKAEALVRALMDCDGVSDCHAVEVRGSGNQRPVGGDVVLGFLPKVAIAGLVSPTAVDALVAQIQQACPTGRSGDGKVFLTPLVRCIDFDPHAEEAG